jgi:hypothetical protein
MTTKLEKSRAYGHGQSAAFISDGHGHLDVVVA